MPEITNQHEANAQIAELLRGLKDMLDEAREDVRVLNRELRALDRRVSDLEDKSK